MPLIFLINSLIVDVFIVDMFFHPDDHGETTQKTALKLFIWKENHYEVKISNPTQFHLIVTYIARGISFHQCEGLLNDTRRITDTFPSSFLNDILTLKVSLELALYKIL
jgi:hypothetical protein